MLEGISLKIERALDAGEGILHMAPTWVPRTFLLAGKRLKLASEDVFGFGANRGGIGERWFSSTTLADNGPPTLPDEGLSYVVGPEGRFLFRDAIEADGKSIIGQQIMDQYGGWPVFAKFFDFLGPIHHHLHMREEHALLVGRHGKPEAYYFPPQLNAIGNSFPYTFFGLEPGTTKADLRQCLERWNEGDNGILDLSRAYRLQTGTGWFLPAGVLHAPGSLLTFEPQWGSDVLAMFQSLLDDRPVPWDLLVKDVPADRREDLDFLVDLLDWEENVRPDFKAKYFRAPKLDEAGSGEGYMDKWVAYDTGNLFSAKELTIDPGAEMMLRDHGPSGAVCVQGRGRLGAWDIESPNMIRFGEVTQDEFFISDTVAKAGVRVRNTGHEPLVILRYFGPA
jgi:hypothetical protein